MLHRRTLLLAAAALPDLAVAQVTRWPLAKPLTIVVPYAAGGSLDATTRLVAQHLATRIGQSVQVENTTGAGGAIGIARGIAAPRDGYTFLMAGDAPLLPGGPGQSSYRHDMLRELIPSVLVNTAPMVLVAAPAAPVSSFDEWVTLVRGKPGRLNYGTSGVGTLPHLAMEMIKARGRLHIVHIPYRGGAPIVNELAGGQIDAALLISASALGPIRAKLLKPIAVTGERRLPGLPDVPTVAESAAFKGFNAVSWAGLYAPAGTPGDIVAAVNREVGEVLKLDAVRGRLAEQGVFVQGGSPADFSAFIERDRAQTLEVLKTLSLKE
ncbi:MAG: Bug family tripartite tricarboxylate transporter substrate binding protein [Aquabacterium sp.]